MKMLQSMLFGFGVSLAGASCMVGDGVDSNADMLFLDAFPYIGLPHSGYEAVPPINPAIL